MLWLIVGPRTPFVEFAQANAGLAPGLARDQIAGDGMYTDMTPLVLANPTARIEERRVRMQLPHIVKQGGRKQTGRCRCADGE